MNNVITNCNIFDLFHLDALSIVVGPGLTDAVVQVAGPLALVAPAAPVLICSFATVVVSIGISTSQSRMLGTSFCTINPQSWSLNLKTLDENV